MTSKEDQDIEALASRIGARPEVLRLLRASCLHVCIPMFGGFCHDSVFQSMMNFMHTATVLGLQLTVESMRNESLIPRARNNMTAGFMSKKDATHLLFIDADIGFEPVDIFKLLCSNVDVVGGIYPVKSVPVRYVCNPVSEGGVQTDHLVEVRHVGTGFLLIKRHVIERLQAAHPELKYRDTVGYGAQCEEFMFALFDTAIDASGHYLSEDWTFCERWRALGGKVFARTDIRLDHHGTHCFRGDLEELKKAAVGGAA
jgi:hypothetical protein